MKKLALLLLVLAMPVYASDPKANYACDRVVIQPAKGGEAALVGAKLEGSNVSRSEGFETLTTIANAPAGQPLKLKFENKKVSRCPPSPTCTPPPSRESPAAPKSPRSTRTPGSASASCRPACSGTTHLPSPTSP